MKVSWPAGVALRWPEGAARSWQMRGNLAQKQVPILLITRQVVELCPPLVVTIWTLRETPRNVNLLPSVFLSESNIVLLTHVRCHWDFDRQLSDRDWLLNHSFSYEDYSWKIVSEQTRSVLFELLRILTLQSI